MSTLQGDEKGIQGAEQQQAGHSGQVGKHLLLAAQVHLQISLAISQRCGSGSAWIRFTFGIWIGIQSKVKIQQIQRLKIPMKAMDAHDEGLEADLGKVNFESVIAL
jgi:hypothetical protein